MFLNGPGAIPQPLSYYPSHNGRLGWSMKTTIYFSPYESMLCIVGTPDMAIGKSNIYVTV